MTKCSIPGCPSTYENTILCRGPQDIYLADAWTQIITNYYPGWNSTKQINLCILHFEKKYIKNNRRIAYALPTLFTSDEIKSGRPSKSIDMVFEGFYEENPYPELRAFVTQKPPILSRVKPSSIAGRLYEQYLHDHGLYAMSKRIKLVFDKDVDDPQKTPPRDDPQRTPPRDDPQRTPPRDDPQRTPPRDKQLTPTPLKCAKCGISSDESDVDFYRFPNPRLRNGYSRAKVWAVFCWPDKNWQSVDALDNLYISNTVLCSEHFESYCTKDHRQEWSLPGDSQFKRCALAKLMGYVIVNEEEAKKNLEEGVSYKDNIQIVDRSPVSESQCVSVDNAELPVHTSIKTNSVVCGNIREKEKHIKFSWQLTEAVVPNDKDSQEVVEIDDYEPLWSEVTCSTEEKKEDNSNSGLFYCNICNEKIEGCRYVCVQCPDWDVCGACEARQLHAQHYVLRAPKDKPPDEVQSMIRVIWQAIQKLDEEAIKVELEDETDLTDPLSTEANQTDSILLSNDITELSKDSLDLSKGDSIMSMTNHDRSTDDNEINEEERYSDVEFLDSESLQNIKENIEQTPPPNRKQAMALPLETMKSNNYEYFSSSGTFTTSSKTSLDKAAITTKPYEKYNLFIKRPIYKIFSSGEVKEVSTPEENYKRIKNTSYSHEPANKQVTSVTDSPLCRACMETEETAAYVLLECPVTATYRAQHLGTPSPRALSEVAGDIKGLLGLLGQLGWLE